MSQPSKHRIAIPLGDCRLGFDIDDTITAYPSFFKELAAHCLKAGGEVHVVSSRSPQAFADTEMEMRNLALPYTALHLLPPISTAQGICPHRELDWYQRYIWLKVDYALNHGLTHFVDDDERVLGLFARYAPHVFALSPIQAKLCGCDWLKSIHKEEQ